MGHAFQCLKVLYPIYSSKVITFLSNRRRNTARSKFSSAYLGISISNDLQWKTHTTNTVKKANSTRGFLRGSLKYSPDECKRLSYIAFVRSTLEYGAIVSDPYKLQDIQSIEKVQRQAARCIKMTIALDLIVA